MRMVFSPMINTLACPMLGGFFLGTRGLLFLISGSNVLILCLSIFLINSGQSWVAARKFILFGFLKDSSGAVISPDSPHYQNLGVGELVGGPFEDTTGPALNNFIKFVAVFAFVTEKLYLPVPQEDTWIKGLATVVGSVFLIVVSKFGLSIALSCIASFLKQRRLQQSEGDEGEEEEDLEGDDLDEDIDAAAREDLLALEGEQGQ